jgi:hypothetical protein
VNDDVSVKGWYGGSKYTKSPFSISLISSNWIFLIFSIFGKTFESLYKLSVSKILGFL